ncbi:hypothetical protein ACH5RR_010557 [Cinchona calisaya]|uniref:Uncharacterized protein n=1 Tax=Cinchona calisaya TaxID=153742 RepID=A0ABD3AJ93_9GENT
MGRAPCCEKMGLKKGPWTKEEDHKLIEYISQHGHGNWRALPKKAGLLRCGKSCRLRWTNYLRPDIKRGNFTQEEEDTIIQLHQALGNRWSAIAARLPGRTDNEIKNVWHTHLKKRLKLPVTAETKQEDINIVVEENKTEFDGQDSKSKSLEIIMQEQDYTTYQTQSSSPHSDATLHNYPESDQDFWFDVVFSSHDPSDITNNCITGDAPALREVDHGCGSFFNTSVFHDMDFWCDIFTTSEEKSSLSALLQF